MQNSRSKLKANLLGAAVLASLVLAGCTQAPVTPPPPPPPPGPTVSITAPSNGATVAADTFTASVSVNHAASLTALKYQLGSGSEVSILGNGSVGAAQLTTTRNFVVQVPASLNNGATTLKVTATDSNGASTSNQINLTINRGNTAAISAGPELQLDNEGRVVLGQNNGVRTLQQNIQGSSADILYAKGTIDIGATPNVRNGQTVTRVEFWVAETPSSPAFDYIGDDLTAPYSVSYDTKRVGTREGLLLYIVVRVTLGNGTNYTSAMPFVVDFTGPESPDQILQGATGAPNTNFLLNVCSDATPGLPDNNWARGVVRHRLSNTDLEDQPLPPGKLPAGVEAVTYYYLPRSLEGSVPIPGSPARAAFIRTNQVEAFRVQFSGGTSDYRVDIDSKAEIADGAYTIYTVMHDQLANETASNFGFRLSIDNTAPVAVGVATDTSPLPFPAQAGFISDYYDLTAVGVDAGVGFNNIFVGQVEFGNGADQIISLGCGPTTNGRVSTNVGTGITFDSNKDAADGPTPIIISISDILGNKLVQFNAGTVTVDNSDPEVEFVSPLPGQNFVAGTDVDVQVNTADATSGVNTTLLLWNDFVPNWDGGERIRTNGFIAAPVQFATGNFAKWVALYPRGTGVNNDPIEPMRLHSITIDNAGNVRLAGRQVDIAENPTAVSLPQVGNFDAYRVGVAPNYRAHTVGGWGRFQGGNGLNPDAVTAVGIGTGGSAAAATQYNVDLSTLGTTGDVVTAIRQGALERWQNDADQATTNTRSILDWLLDVNGPGNYVGPFWGDPSLEYDGTLFPRRTGIEGWADVSQDSQLAIGGLDEDGSGAVETAPWFIYANTSTSAGLHRSQASLLTPFLEGVNALGFVIYGTNSSVANVRGEYELAYEDVNPYGRIVSVNGGATFAPTKTSWSVSATPRFEAVWLAELYNMNFPNDVDLRYRNSALSTSNFGAVAGINYNAAIGAAPGDYRMRFSTDGVTFTNAASTANLIGPGSALSAEFDSASLVTFIWGQYNFRGADIGQLGGIGVRLGLNAGDDFDPGVSRQIDGPTYGISVIP